MKITGRAPQIFVPAREPSALKSPRRQEVVDTTYHGLLVCPNEGTSTLMLASRPSTPVVRDYAFCLGERFEGGAIPTDVTEAWRQRSGTTFSDSLKSLFEGTILTSKNASVGATLKDSELDYLDFDMRMQSKGTAERAGVMARVFDFSNKSGPTVEHSYLKFEPEFQDAGLAKEILSRSMRLYERLGMERVTLTAGLSVGGYAWAKYGFKPDSSESLSQLYDEVGWNLEQLDLAPRTHNIVERLMRSDDPKTIWTISDLDQLVTSFDGEKMKLGKALLLGTSWSGELDMTDEESRQRFDQYVSQDR